MNDTSGHQHRELLETLNQIGIALSSQRDLDDLLDRIVREAMNVTSAEGGSLFTVEGDHLRFAVTRNDVLKEQMDASPGSQIVNNQIPLSRESISGYVADTGELLEIEDAYDLPDNAPYSFDPTFDERHQYRTTSMLGVPLEMKNGEVLGVLLLVNARDGEGNVTTFPGESIDIIQSLASQAGVAIRNAQLNEQLKTSYLESIQRLSIAAEFKDPDTADHIQRMSEYSRRLAEAYGWTDERAERMQYASSMHDVGKIGVPDRILLKTGTLTDQEYDEMKKHTRIGHRILKGSEHEIMELSANIALTHHEKWNGTGYPRGLEGENIPIEGRLVAIADVFDALTTERPYKDAFPIDRSVNLIKDDRGSHFDPSIVDAFENCLDDLLNIKARFDQQKDEGGAST